MEGDAMGAAPNKIPGGEAMADGSRWVCLTAGQAGVGHSGCSLGRIDRAAGESVWRGTARRKAELYLAADTSQAALDTYMATLTTAPSGGPWPGVVPATWWAGLTATERADWREAILEDGRHRAG